MNSIKVSILVPICNVEKFLAQCLTSLVNQTLKDIEIICINDGSKDSSLDIINEFANVDSRIVVIDKKNSGYGDSMNKGLAIAKGEYIGIVESDDYADLNMFEELYKLAKGNNADLVKTNFNEYWGKTGKIEFFNGLNIDQRIIDTEKAREKVLFGVPAIWSAIYRRQFLNDNDVHFLPTPGASYQDTSFNFKAAATAERIIVSPEAFLNYRQDNANSSVKIANKEKIMYVNKEYDEIKRYIYEHRLEKLISVYCTLRFKGYMWNYFRISDDIKNFYWNVILEEINEHGDEWNIIPNKLGKIFTVFNGYKLVITNQKFLFDCLIKLRNIKNSL